MGLVRTIFLVCMFSFAGFGLSAQEATHVFTVKKSAQKVHFAQKWANFQKNFSLAPHYSASMGAGLSFAYTPSGGVSVVGNITSRGYVLLGLQGRHMMKGGKWEFNHNSFYCFAPVHYWGTGFLNGNDNANKVRYDKRYLNLGGQFLYRSKEFYVGPSFGYENVAWDKMSGDGFFNLGFTLGYDSRDNAAAPDEGVNTVIAQKWFIGNFGSTAVKFDTYCGVWNGGVLAFDLYSEFAYSQVPWYAMPSIGGTERMRGYYKGRYRDNNMVTAQVELRQHIWELFSAAAWIGAGNVWGSGGAFSLRHTLPNYGVGLRVKMGGAMALRFDWGFGKKGQNGFILGINEAF